MDEGVYQCQISTKNDHESYNIMLHVRCMYHVITAIVSLTFVLLMFLFYFILFLF